MPNGPRRLPRIDPGVPPKPGSQPVPEGTMRFHHYTWGRNVPGIEAEGLKRSISEEKFAHGGTESPQVFATAGVPSERDLQDTAGGDKHYVEGFAHMNQLDIGSPGYGARNMSSEQLGEHIERVESHHNTITFHGDVPRDQIQAIHAPWHNTARFFAGERGSERSIMGGDYEGIDEGTDKALNVAKMALAAKVMVGGKLSGKSWADMDAEKAAKKD